MIFYHIARNTVTLLLLRRRFGRWPTPPRALVRDQLPEEALEASLMSSVSAPTRTAKLDNFVWWHRLRRHKIERGGEWWSGWNSGMLALVLHCQKCNVEWNWTVR
jgi:hypothetical protein